jgi:Asp-tRNA(Asn)/Glu-tRNA(Gln) amidotransferase A subunit family amidase
MTNNRQSLLDLIRLSRTNPAARPDILSSATRRADEVEPWLRAFVFRPPAYKAAGEGPLAGIPVAVKDIIATKDMPTAYNSPIYEGHVPDADAWIVERIKALGGVPFGKTVTTEFAWRHPGPTVNPWNRAHTPGGSSSGSAASVAAGIVPLALGTQTVGSVIRPAAYCGVTGYKPSYESIPRAGAHPLAGTLDHIGFFSVTAEDAAVVHALFIAGESEVLASDEAWNAYFKPLTAPPRLGVLRSGLWNEAEPAQQRNFLDATEKLRDAGAEIVACEVMDDAGAMFDTTNLILAVEAARVFTPLIEKHPGKVSERLRALVTEGQKIPAGAYEAALAARTEWQASLARSLAGFDAVLSLPAPGQAPEGLAETGNAMFCASWTLLGWPAVTIPSGWTEAGLPLGLQFAGPFGQDMDVLRAASWAEAVLRPAARTVG